MERLWKSHFFFQLQFAWAADYTLARRGGKFEADGDKVGMDESLKGKKAAEPFELRRCRWCN